MAYLIERLNMINSDSYYEIGAGHTYCQDYAWHGSFNVESRPFHFAVVSDGCSGSADSDLGSRFLARHFSSAAKLAISFNSTNLEDDIKENLLAIMDQGINMYAGPNALDATLVAILYDVANDTLHSFAWGDGSIYYKFKNGKNGAMTNISYIKNAPYYLNYQRRGKQDNYEAHFGTMYADVLPYSVTPEGTSALINEGKYFQKFHYEKFEKASEVLRFAAVFTDGIETYHKKDDVNTLMPRHNVYNQLTQYKGFHGKFVERRMLMIKKFCQKEGWQHFDDVAAATISF